MLLVLRVSIFDLSWIKKRGWGITGAPKGACCPSSASSFPEDCVRLKLSSTRASQAGLKEMMMQMKNESYSNEQFGEESILSAE